MKLARIVAIITAIITVVVCVLIATSPMPFMERVLISQILSISLLLTGGGVILLLSIKRFQRQLKIVYLYICLSLLLVLIGVWQYVFLSVAGLLESPWVVWGGSDVPFILSVTLTYISARKVALLLAGKGALTNIPLVIAVSVAASAALAFAVKTLSGSADFFDALYVTISTFETLLAFAAAILIYRARGTVSSLYKPALAGLLGYCIITAVAGLNTLLMLAIPPTHWYVTYNVGGFLYVFSGLSIIFAALGFNRIGYVEKNQLAAPVTSARSPDVVVALTALASQPATLDPLLDEMRVVTANAPVDGRLTDAQQKVVAKVYLAVETFLVTKEPVRKYSREHIREMIEIRFKASVNEPLFWGQIAAGDKV